MLVKVKILIRDSFRQKQVWEQEDHLRLLCCRSKLTKDPHFRQLNGQI